MDLSPAAAEFRTDFFSRFFRRANIRRSHLGPSASLGRGSMRPAPASHRLRQPGARGGHGGAALGNGRIGGRLRPSLPCHRPDEPGSRKSRGRACGESDPSRLRDRLESWSHGPEAMPTWYPALVSSPGGNLTDGWRPWADSADWGENAPRRDRGRPAAPRGDAA